MSRRCKSSLTFIRKLIDSYIIIASPIAAPDHDAKPAERASSVLHLRLAAGRASVAARSRLCRRNLRPVRSDGACALAYWPFSRAPRQAELAEALSIEGPTLVRLLDQLCAAGLVTRREDPTDRRAKVLSLTKVGLGVVAKIEAELVELRANVLAKVSAADLEASLRVLQGDPKFCAARARSAGVGA